jgi:hypothetical protein
MPSFSFLIIPEGKTEKKQQHVEPECRMCNYKATIRYNFYPLDSSSEEKDSLNRGCRNGHARNILVLLRR